MNEEAPSTAKALQSEAGALRKQIVATALEIIAVSREICGLVLLTTNATETKDQIARLEAQQALLEKQQTELKTQQAKAEAELAKITSGSQLADPGPVLSKTLTSNIGKMLFVVLGSETHDRIGVSFFVRPTLAVTAYHVLSGIDIGDRVNLLREAGLFRNPEEYLIATTLVKFNKEEDWALMKVNKPTADIIPFTIGNAIDARWFYCRVLGYNIGLSSAEETMLPRMTNVSVTPHGYEERLFLYCSVGQEEDSGGAVLVSPTGEAVAMYCEFRRGVSRGIRLDYMQQQGYFDGY